MSNITRWDVDSAVSSAIKSSESSILYQVEDKLNFRFGEVYEAIRNGNSHIKFLNTKRQENNTNVRKLKEEVVELKNIISELKNDINDLKLILKKVKE